MNEKKKVEEQDGAITLSNEEVFKRFANEKHNWKR